MSANLTPAETKYLGLLAGGLTPLEISERTGVGRATVYTALNRVRRKIGVKSNNQLISVYYTKRQSFTTKGK